MPSLAGRVDAAQGRAPEPGAEPIVSTNALDEPIDHAVNAANLADLLHRACLRLRQDLGHEQRADLGLLVLSVQHVVPGGQHLLMFRVGNGVLVRTTCGT